MKSITYGDIKDTLASAIGGGSLSDDVDEDMLDYFINVLLALEPSSLTTDEIRETVEPFLESFEDHDYSDDEALLDQVTLSLEKLLLGNSNESSSELKLLDSSKQVNMQEELKKSADAIFRDWLGRKIDYKEFLYDEVDQKISM